MINLKHIAFVIFSICSTIANGQNVEILSYNVNSFGQVELQIDGEADKYYILTAQHEPNLSYSSNTSMTMGVDGEMTITEPLKAYSRDNYQITAYDRGLPTDSDGDGIDDITEFNNMPTRSPFNFGRLIPFNDGAASIPSREVYSDLAVIDNNIPWAQFLNNQEFVKFAIVNQGSNSPEVYFINSKTHYIHADFLNTINVDQFGDDVVTGEIVYNPNVILPNGVIGRYSFNYSFGFSESFEVTGRTFELLAANMPFLRNNLQHFISTTGEANYQNIHKDGFVDSRVEVILESQVFEDVDYIPLNEAEGYGFFKHMDLEDNPGSRDIVLYDVLPNSLPRVGGIITSIVQTPLSHVNLRAIQDNVPNAYIKNPLEIDSIANLLDKFIYYKVEGERYFIREATQEEVNAWYENIRPTEPQTPMRDLSQKEILPLDEIGFEMATSFGAKCSNVATMRKFGFPQGTIPNGFGVPFYYYDEFMKFNGFYDDLEVMLDDPQFISDLETRIDMLKDFRKEIRAADMPQWMLDDLQAMHDQFPEGTPVRCRSSTNNEDLPGFSGAGLYTSKTQYPDEGHISKSIKQVYASMWNFRAYDERDFYRVNQYIAAMGVLCHPNYQDEKSNGVGVSIDPIYDTQNTFYLNTQVGESLITNPDENSIPEEMLLSENPEQGYFVLRNSNLVDDGELVMGEVYLDQMREYLKVIHDEFAILYNVVGAEGFGMDIEYKVTKDDQLIIKQARPWVSFWADIKATYDLAVVGVRDPVNSASLSDSELITVTIANRGLEDMSDFDISLIKEGAVLEVISISDTLTPRSEEEYQFSRPQDFSQIQDYDYIVAVANEQDGYIQNDSLSVTVSKIHLLEVGLTSRLNSVNCDDEIDMSVTFTNYGESKITTLELEVIANGLVVETLELNTNISYLSERSFNIDISQNIQGDANEISFNLLSVNEVQDAVLENNSSVNIIDLESEFASFNFIINADDWPQETSWIIVDGFTGEGVAFGALSSGDDIVETPLCLDRNSCYELHVFDSQNDGICCGFGIGDFSVINSEGVTIIANDGDFGGEAIEYFCGSESGCRLDADIDLSNVSATGQINGSILIEPKSGFEPYSFSINGGQTFFSVGNFASLPAGEYDVVVKDATAICLLEETVTVGVGTVNNVDVGDEIVFSMYPNPTSDEITVSFGDTFEIGETIKINVTNSLGQTMKNELIKVQSQETRTTVSLDGYPAGTYILNCTSGSIEASMRVLRL